MNCSRWFQNALLSSIIVTTFGGCLFPLEWTGRWFQSGIGHLNLNFTYFESKGECVQKDGDKYVVNERSEKEPCKRCLAVYKRHDNVIQYKESNCLPYDSLDELCHDITGDQPLLSMFRADNASTIPCPFKSPPYKFSYNRGSGECSQNSRIDSCTDDSKLLIYFAACPDVPGTESGVEELNCLATWKEGNGRYLVAKIKKDLMVTDEDSYRCFMYSKRPGPEMAYLVAQSGDATCTGVTSPSEGSKTMQLTRLESSWERCRFPSWVVSHHHWLSLDGEHSYHFSHRNATLRISRDHGPTEMRLVCHHLVANSSSVTLVAHATAGCKNGYICMVFHKRDTAVIQLQQSSEMVHDYSEACIPPFTDSYLMSSPITLTTVSLPLVRCPQAGQYTASGPVWNVSPETDTVCPANNSLYIGCLSSPQLMTLQTCSPDSSAAYHCHGSWTDDRTTYFIASAVSRKSTDAKRYCFVLSEKTAFATLHRLSDSCILPDTHGPPALNLTLQGSCTEKSGATDSSVLVMPCLLSVSLAVLLCSILR